MIARNESMPLYKLQFKYRVRRKALVLRCLPCAMLVPCVTPLQRCTSPSRTPVVCSSCAGSFKRIQGRSPVASPSPWSPGTGAREVHAGGRDVWHPWAATPPTEALDKIDVQAVSTQLQLSNAEVLNRLKRLQQLLPGIQHGMASMTRRQLAWLVKADVSRAVENLLEVKRLFPAADAARMGAQEPFIILYASPSTLRRAAAQLRELLPCVDLDRAVESEPSILNLRALKQAMINLQRYQPHIKTAEDVQKTLEYNPRWFMLYQWGDPNSAAAGGGRRTPWRYEAPNPFQLRL